MSLLQLDAVAKRFGTVEALRGVSFGVEAGTVVGLVGDNGAGKSTLMKCITGIYRADAGAIRFADGERFSGGDESFIVFESIDHNVTATGVIEVDGTFRLGTYEPGDGAVAGAHRVSITPPTPAGDSMPNVACSDWTTGAIVQQPRHATF